MCWSSGAGLTQDHGLHVHTRGAWTPFPGEEAVQGEGGVGPGRPAPEPCRTWPRLPGGAAGAQGTLEPSPSQTSLGGGPLSSLAGLCCLGPLPSQGLLETWVLLWQTPAGCLSFSESLTASLVPPAGRSSPAPFTRCPLHEGPVPQASISLSGLPHAPLPEGPAAPCQALDIPPACGQGVRAASTRPWGPPRLGSLPGSGGQVWASRACRAGAPRVHPPQWRLHDGAATWEAECWPPAPWWSLRGSQDPVVSRAPAGTGSPAAALLGFSIKTFLWSLWPASSGQHRAHSGPRWEQHRPRREGIPSDICTSRTSVVHEELELRGNPGPWTPGPNGTRLCHPSCNSWL